MVPHQVDLFHRLLLLKKKIILTLVKMVRKTLFKIIAIRDIAIGKRE